VKLDSSPCGVVGFLWELGGKWNEKIEVEKMIASTLLREFIFLHKTKSQNPPIW
jgi:hypothetical protein